MAVSDKTRRILWARSGNRCAFCRCELVMARTEHDPEAVVGDECHIIGREPGSSRHSPDPAIDLDGYDNLILLCKTHHKLVDDQPEEYPVDRLRVLKATHEEWVRSTLENEGRRQGQGQKTSFPGVLLLSRLRTGKDAAGIARGAHMLSFSNDDPETENELDLISTFAGYIQDFDTIAELGPADVVRVQFELSSQIRDLEAAGFVIFGGRQRRKMRFGNITDAWLVATVCVVRQTNPAIIRVNDEERLLTVEDLR